MRMFKQKKIVAFPLLDHVVFELLLQL